MKIFLRELTLVCRAGTEDIDLAHHIDFFHGKISAGKSSILRLIDFALGNGLEKTLAIERELVSVRLTAELGNNSVVLERRIGENTVFASWQNEQRQFASVTAPILAAEQPIAFDNVYNLSDLLLYLLGVGPVKVRKSKLNDDSDLVRLGFRDFMWYCYLEQDELDSSFFQMDDQFKRLKSRDVARFVLGYYSGRLSELEMQLESSRDERSSARGTIQQLRAILQELGFQSEADVLAKRGELQQQLSEREEAISKLSERMVDEQPHYADELRQKGHEMSMQLSVEEQALRDLELQTEQQQALRSELISAKFKAQRAVLAVNLLSGVRFEACPACGTHVARGDSFDVCYLCQQEPRDNASEQVQFEATQADLINRIGDLDVSIARHESAISRQKKRIDNLRANKLDLDQNLDAISKEYNSAFLARSRMFDREIAELRQQLKTLADFAEFNKRIQRLVLRVDELDEVEKRLREEIDVAKDNLVPAEANIASLEATFLECLLSVGVPGVSSKDEVRINRKTWIPYILSEGDEQAAWSFDNAGSGGKKTLFNVCYALAIHITASRNQLPLPTLLMIDTPMKNIGEDVNRDIFQAFYRTLYRYAQHELKGTQIILVDKEFVKPDDSNLDLYDRFMTPGEKEHPPLIRYYSGP